MNRTYPGITLAFVGTLANAIVILANGGYMPIWAPSLAAAGFTPADVPSTIHILLPPLLDANFLVRLGPLGDVIPIPFPFIQNVASVGDLFLMAGLAFFLFASVVRVPLEMDEEESKRVRERLQSGSPQETGLTPALAGVAGLERSVVLGGARGRLVAVDDGIPAPKPRVGERIRPPSLRRLASTGRSRRCGPAS